VSPFEFFFSFYGLLLGFSVAELVGGFARVVHERRKVRVGPLAFMLAVFVAVDIATFWNQAWLIYRFAPFNYALLVLGLLVAGIFYVAATLVFPKVFEAGASLDDHFWEHRRIVLLCVLAANWIGASLFLLNAIGTGELAAFALPWTFWAGLALFTLATLVAALGRGRRVVTAALVILLLYQAYNVVRAGMSLVEAGGWSMLQSQEQSAGSSSP
jgi:hypothetical protein